MSGPRPLHALSALAILAIVIAVLGVGIFGFGGSRTADPDAMRGRSVATSRVPTSSATSPAATQDVPAADGAGAIAIGLVATKPDESSRPLPVIDELEDGDVLRMRVTDLRPAARGFVRQCAREPGGFAGCTNTFPIQVNDEGVAYFQYQVRDHPRRCGPFASCVVVASDDDGEAVVYTVFGATAPPAATVELRPVGPYRAGARVEVQVAPMAPGAAVDIAFCANTCGPSTRATADRGGFARTSIVLGETCVGGERCAIVATGVATRDAVAFVRFVTGPTATYDTWRLAVGLTAAALLVLAARALARRTDWRGPSDAETPALDEVSL